MLVALLGYLLFGGGGGIGGGVLSRAAIEHISQQVEAEVEDVARGKSALSTLDDLDGVIKQFDNLHAESLESIRELYKVHESNSSQMQGVVDRFVIDWQISQNLAIEHRYTLKNLLTEDEWKKVFDAQ